MCMERTCCTCVCYPILCIPTLSSWRLSIVVPLFGRALLLCESRAAFNTARPSAPYPCPPSVRDAYPCRLAQLSLKHKEMSNRRPSRSRSPRARGQTIGGRDPVSENEGGGGGGGGGVALESLKLERLRMQFEDASATADAASWVLCDTLVTLRATESAVRDAKRQAKRELDMTLRTLRLTQLELLDMADADHAMRIPASNRWGHAMQVVSDQCRQERMMHVRSIRKYDEMLWDAKIKARGVQTTFVRAVETKNEAQKRLTHFIADSVEEVPTEIVEPADVPTEPLDGDRHPPPPQ